MLKKSILYVLYKKVSRSTRGALRLGGLDHGLVLGVAPLIVFVAVQQFYRLDDPVDDLHLGEIVVVDVQFEVYPLHLFAPSCCGSYLIKNHMTVTTIQVLTLATSPMKSPLVGLSQPPFLPERYTWMNLGKEVT